MQRTRQIVASLGPYVLLEALMPGGTLMVAALYLLRRKRERCSG